MSFKPRRRFVAISMSTALTSLLMLATPAAAGQAPANSTESHAKTVDIVGGNFLEVNQSITITYRFKPGTIHVKHGDKLVLTNHTDDGHSLTLVSASLLPKTINSVFSCGGPGTICGEVAQAHFPMGFPQGPPSGCTSPRASSTSTTDCRVRPHRRSTLSTHSPRAARRTATRY